MTILQKMVQRGIKRSSDSSFLKTDPTPGRDWKRTEIRTVQKTYTTKIYPQLWPIRHFPKPTLIRGRTPEPNINTNLNPS